MGLWHTDGSPNLSQKPRCDNNQRQKKKTWKIVDFAVPADHRIKLKECEKKDNNLELLRELNKLWNMKTAIIPIVIGAFGSVTKGLLEGLEDLKVEGRLETIQTTTLLRRLLETWGDLLSRKFQWKKLVEWADVAVISGKMTTRLRKLSIKEKKEKEKEKNVYFVIIPKIYHRFY